MKKILLLSISSIIVVNSFCQIAKTGVIKDNVVGFSKYDTVLVFGAQNNKGKSKYYVQGIKDNFVRSFVPEENLELLPDTLNFWENIWFESAIYEHYQNKKQFILSSGKEEEILRYLGELESDNKFYDDPYVEDYISQLINRIYPERLSIDNSKINITPKLINDPKTKIQSLPNGFLLIGIDYLARLDSEEKLISDLVKGISHIVLKHNIVNINKYGIYGSDPFGRIYSNEQSKIASNTAKQYFDFHSIKDTNKGYFLSEMDFLSKLSGIVNYVAWQEYYSNHLEKSVELINKLINNDLAAEETYYLKAMILRQTNNDYQSNMQALELLEKAEENPVHGYMDIYKEKGLLLLRLGRTSEANEAFQQYKTALNMQPVPDPNKIKWCNYMLYRCSKEINQTAKLN